MNPGTPFSGRKKSIPRWLIGCVAVVVVALSFVLLQSSGPKSKVQRIVVLATGFTNGEQVVTFRLEPLNSDVTCAEVVSVSDIGSTQPPTIRTPWGDLMPASFGNATNSTIRYVSLPKRGASIAGKPLAYTPGSYTVAYTPKTNANRIRVGAALERAGLEDWVQRCGKSIKQKSLLWLRHKTHEDAVFITSEPITNGVAVARQAD